ncbi:multicopper oxidase family protein [Neobacillus sp. D3-1R]|uniref:multicopper oxidase family protein n=1 Tax=Neobacillus sp. D3-1R TaxID=3445778 RepID=UPI003FA0357A
MKKIIFAAIIIILILVLGGSFFMKNMNMGGNMPSSGMKYSAEDSQNSLEFISEIPLPIPPLLKDENPDPNKAEFTLVAQKGKMEFLKGKQTPTYGYNGDFLGPVIRVKKGDEVLVKVKNSLDEATTLHWHGLEVDGDQDGGPHNGIQPGTIWTPGFKIEQPAATLWYHPHLFHKTAEHVYKGLAGLFYIDDEISNRLDIPKDYGVNDIPLVIQDRKFSSNGKMEYELSMHDGMMGLQGDTILVNGAINPYLEVPKGKVRLRLLNGSNARIYQFYLTNNQEFLQIASDGGLLENPVKISKLILSPGERAEIIVDFSSLRNGDTLDLTDQGFPFMKFKINKSKENQQFVIPNKLTDIPKIDPSTAVTTRKFVLQGMGPNVNINGKQMDMDRIDETLKLHDTEIWEITNESTGMMGMAHPFHAHGVQFQLMDRDGNPPPMNETGWKDTILIYPGEKVRVIATFDKKGIFMYHCHILEHEDAGMMGQFLVE